MTQNDADFTPEDVILPVFWTPPTDGDFSILQRQMNGRRFDVSCVAAVAKRCVHGFPQVIVTKPVTSQGTPFPTLFWLTCPHLDKICGRLEAERKIADVEKIFAENADEVKKMHEEYAALRMTIAHKCGINTKELSESKRSTIEKSGVGGIDTVSAPNAAKCLHLQLATFWGMKKHPAENWLRENVVPTECLSVLCEGNALVNVSAVYQKIYKEG